MAAEIALPALALNQRILIVLSNQIYFVGEGFFPPTTS